MGGGYRKGSQLGEELVRLRSVATSEALGRVANIVQMVAFWNGNASTIGEIKSIQVSSVRGNQQNHADSLFCVLGTGRGCQDAGG